MKKNILIILIILSLIFLVGHIHKRVTSDGTIDIAHGEMYMYENANATVIGNTDQWIAVHDFITGTVFDFTFDAGGETGAITAFADAGGGEVTVTSAGHTLAANDIISIDGTTNYNDMFVVQSVSGNDFNIIDVWAGDDAAGTYTQASTLTANGVLEDEYYINYNISVTPTSNNDTLDFRIYINAVVQENTETRTQMTLATAYTTVSASGVIDIEADDIVSIGIKNLSGANNVTIRYANVNLNRM